MNKKEVKFGIIGLGNIANKFAKTCNYLNYEIAAVASRDIDKANSFKNKYKANKAYGSYEDLMKDKAVDCVYIATPHAFHYKYMLLALKYNKHILCEKPFTLNAKQAKEIFELAKKKNVFVMEAMWTKFLPAIEDTIKKVKEGIIGDIIEIDARFSFYTFRKIQRLYNLDLGGGALLDIGIYPITLTNIFLGKPNKIDSTVDMYKDTIDRGSDIIYYYPTNQKAYIRNSFKKYVGHHLIIRGTKGYLKIPRFVSGDKVTYYFYESKKKETYKYPLMFNGFEYEINHVVDCILKGQIESNIMKWQDTLDVLEQLDDIRHNWSMYYPIERKEV